MLTRTTKPGSQHGPSIKNPRVYDALRRQGMSKQRAARISNAQLHKRRKSVADLELAVARGDPQWLIDAIASAVPELPRYKGEQIAPGITRIRGNLCNVHGRYGRCPGAGVAPAKPAKAPSFVKPRTPAKAPRRAGGKRGGGGGAAPKKTDEQKRQEREQARAAEGQANRDAVSAALAGADASLGPTGVAKVLAAAAGGALSAQDGASLEKLGYAQKNPDGTYRLSPEGRALANAANRGDTRAALDADGRAQERAAKLAKEQAAKPAGGGGGGGKKKPTDDEKQQQQAQERAKRAEAAAPKVGLSTADVSALREAAESGGVQSTALEKLGLIGLDGMATDAGRRALNALERGDVRGYRAALQDAKARIGREQAAAGRAQEQSQARQQRAAETARRDQERAQARAAREQAQTARRTRVQNVALRRLAGGGKLSDRQAADLEAEGLVTIDPRGAPRLTPVGRARLGRTLERAKAQDSSERAMFAKMGGGGGGGGGGSGGGGSKLWPKNPDTGKREPPGGKKPETEKTNIDKARDTVREAEKGKVFGGMLKGDEGAGTYEARNAFARMTHESNGEAKTLPIKSLVAETTSFEADRVARFMGESKIRKEDAPTVMRYDGKNYLMDGHHRVLSRAALGENEVPVRVYDVSDVKSGGGVMIPNRRRKSFVVFKDARGQWRWVGFSSTAYKDRDGEIVSTKALEADVARADTDGIYGPLRWWHQPGLDLGDCDFNAMHGRILIESGTFRTEAIARKIARVADRLALSLGFVHPPSEPDRDGVFHTIRRFERSLTPSGKASNLFTSFHVKGLDMDKTKIEQLKAIGGLDDGDIADIIARADAKMKTADAANTAYKAEDAPPQQEITIGGVTYLLTEKAPPTMAEEAEAAVVEEQAADMPMGEETGAGGLTLSPEDLQAIGQVIGEQMQTALAQIMGGLDLEKKVAGHVQTLLQPYQATKDAADAEKAEQIAALKAQQEATAAKLAELMGDQPAVQPYRASQADDTLETDPELLQTIKDAGLQASPFGDLYQNFFGNGAQPAR